MTSGLGGAAVAPQAPAVIRERKEPSSYSWRTLMTLIVGSFIGIYHVVSLNVALPGFMTIFGAELSTVQWLVTGFTLATGIIAPLSGYFGDKWSNKTLFLASLAGLTISSVLCALAWNIYVLIAFRILQGIFCGLIQPVSLTMLYQSVPADKRPLAVSLWSASGILGPALAPTVSGWLQGYNWHWMFVVMLPLSLATMGYGWRHLPGGGHASRRRADWTGIVLAVVGSLALLLLFGKVHAWGWGSPLAIGCLCVGLAAAAAFVLHELRASEPLLQLRLFRLRLFTASLGASVVLIIGLYSGIYFIPLYLQQIHAMTSLEVGLLLLPPALCLGVSTLLSGKLYPRLGPVPLVVAGAVLLAWASWQFSLLTPDTPEGYVMLWMSVRYVGVGLSMTPAMNAGMGAVASELAGDASALINWLRQVFGALGLGLFTSLFYARFAVHERQLADASNGWSAERLHEEAYTMGINDAFLVAGWFGVAAIPLALLLGSRVRWTRRAKAASAPREEGGSGL
ncbi:DHA2 family efflux MFS transporter permease subunit [Paenibacillus xanthanilyticus]